MKGSAITTSGASPASNPHQLNGKPDCAIAVFAKMPVPGRAKTRLAPVLGRRGAAELQAALTSDTLRKLVRLASRASLFLLTTGSSQCGGPSAAPGCDAEVALFRNKIQRGKDLGERLAHAFRSLLRDYQRVVIIGTDSPALSAPVLLQALRALTRADAVLGPCPDGGYYLVGLRRRKEHRLAPDLFRGVHWGTSSAFEDTLRSFTGAGLACEHLDLLHDVDTPQDLERLRSQLAASAGMRRRAPATWKFLSASGALGARNATRFFQPAPPERTR